MPDLMNIGTSALLSFRTAINTTSHNIANANTDGYSRQRAVFESLPSSFEGGFYLGSGVGVDSIQRIYDNFLRTDVLNRSSAHSSAESYYAFAARADTLLGDSTSGLQSSLDSFYAAFQDVANNPSALPERQALVGQAAQLVDRFRALSGAFDNMNNEINFQAEALVEDINSLTSQIASLNDEISLTNGDLGNTPNDLLDQRDRLIKELSSKLSVNTIQQSDGAVNITLSNGTSLVTGSSSSELITFRSEFDASRVQIGYSNSVSAIDISDTLSGGALGGILDFRSNLLDETRAQLGFIAAAVGEAVNAQHELGVDLQGNQGTDFFSPLTINAVNSVNNTGTASVAVSLSDLGQLTAGSYELSFDGVTYRLTNLDDNTSQTGPGPFNVNGLTISVSGAAVAGDSFLIQPTRDAAAQFSLAINDPRSIAAASAVTSNVPITNSGTFELGNLSVTNAAAIPLAGTVTLTFNPNALGAGVPGFDVTGMAGGPIAYDPATQSAGLDVTLGDLSFRLSGTPADGDVATIGNNTSADGDNRNALAIASLQTSQNMLGGTASQRDLYATLVADVGIKTSRAEATMETESALLNQSEQTIESISGVNLDEEAADLIRFQQAFQAAAQIISVAETLFDSLLAATRR